MLARLMLTTACVSRRTMCTPISSRVASTSLSLSRHTSLQSGRHLSDSRRTWGAQAGRAADASSPARVSLASTGDIVSEVVRGSSALHARLCVSFICLLNFARRRRHGMSCACCVSSCSCLSRCRSYRQFGAARRTLRSLSRLLDPSLSARRCSSLGSESMTLSRWNRI